MSRTVPCPHASSGHGPHEAGSREYRKCREISSQEQIQRTVREDILAGKHSEISHTLTAGSAPTLKQQLEALANRPAPKGKSGERSFGD